MIPLRDEIRAQRTPLLNYLLLALNIVVFVLMWLAGPEQEALVYRFALIPAQLTAGPGLGDVSDIFTSMFMHAGLAHLGGNMLYLWIFGDNVEDSMGSLKYLAFYLVGGIAASLVHVLTNPNSQIPTVGASGAIAAVLGGYLVLYPQSRVMTLIPLGLFTRVTLVPAAIVLGVWFVLQLFSGFLSLGGPEDVGGVAFWAHVGGFVAGVVLARLLAGGRRPETAARW
jgi:membrane associated rhomboid family serine protease